ncbi:MAG: ABC transporter ATP-binding protein [Hyphomonadaceae bacterium]|nr:ABC transporter ATP-binding protein [Hyphomonadaceae bacterium]
MNWAISTEGLTRRFGDRTVVDGVSLSVPRGGVYGFLGPNGAGKTTTIRMLLGLIRPSSGSIQVLGRAMPRQRLAIARCVGAMVETPSLYDHLTARENLDQPRRVRGLPTSEIERVLSIVDLTGDSRRRVGGFSLGMRQRLGIARALLGRPELLILDEPTNGLDPAGIRDMRQLIRDLPSRDATSIMISSHLLAEVEQTASHVGLMFQGKLLAQSALTDFLALAGGRIEIGVRSAQKARQVLSEFSDGITLVDAERLSVTPHPKRTPDAATINARLVGAGLVVYEITSRPATLEDVFMKLTTDVA